jgi:hypothetical protein
VTDLHPDIVRAIREMAGTKLGRRYDRYTRREYGMPGWKVMAKTTAGEFGGRSTRTGRGVVSSAGARGPAQFIPSTREAFRQQHGVDPWRNDRQAFKGMMLHHLNSGGIQGYNPGMPTYEDYILGQKIDRSDRRAIKNGLGANSGGGSVTPGRRGTTTVGFGPDRIIPGQSFAPDRRAARRQLLMDDDISMDDLLAYKGTVNGLKDVPDRRVRGDLQVNRQAGTPTEYSSKVTGKRFKHTPGGIYEVFYDPPGEYWDSGAVQKGAIGGHPNHVHVSADRKLVVKYGRLAQRMGLHVSEQSKFDQVDPVHTDGSFHYKDMAIDVSGDANKMAAFYRLVMKEARRGRGR